MIDVFVLSIGSFAVDTKGASQTETNQAFSEIFTVGCRDKGIDPLEFCITAGIGE